MIPTLLSLLALTLLTLAFLPRAHPPAYLSGHQSHREPDAKQVRYNRYMGPRA